MSSVIFYFVMLLFHTDHESHESLCNKLLNLGFVSIRGILQISGPIPDAKTQQTDAGADKIKIEFVGILDSSYVYAYTTDKNTYECLRIDYDSVMMPKNALRICYELTTMFWNREFVAKTLNSSKHLLIAQELQELTTNKYESVKNFTN